MTLNLPKLVDDLISDYLMNYYEVVAIIFENTSTFVNENQCILFLFFFTSADTFQTPVQEQNIITTFGNHNSYTYTKQTSCCYFTSFFIARFMFFSWGSCRSYHGTRSALSLNNLQVTRLFRCGKILKTITLQGKYFRCGMWVGKYSARKTETRAQYLLNWTFLEIICLKTNSHYLYKYLTED